MKLLNGKAPGWFYPVLTIISLLILLYFEHDSFNSDVDYFRISDNSLAHFKERFQKAESDEIKTGLVNGFVWYGLSGDTYYLKGMQERHTAFEIILIAAIGINLLNIIRRKSIDA